MSSQPEPWGGELYVTRLLRRFRKRRVANDTPERQRELHDHCEPPSGKSDPYRAAQDLLGPDVVFLPRDVRRQRERYRGGH
jgi:hypothetical protein